MGQPDTGSPPARTANHQWWWRRGATGVVALVLLLATGAGALATSQVVQDQEQRLRHQRAREVAALLTNVTNQLQQALSNVGTAATIVNDQPARLTPMLAPLVGQGGYRSVAIVDTRTDTVVAGAGVDSGAGTALPSGVAGGLSRVGPQLVSTGVFRVGNQARLGFVIQPPGLAPLAVYAEAAINPSAQAPVTKGQPFSDLTVALYASPKADPAELALQTKDPPKGSHGAVLETVPVGADKWLLVVKARRPLVGGVANAVPWMILAGGVLLAIAVGAIVEVLLRQRTRVESLVEERTAELRDSLDKLEEAQERLVRQERLAAIGELAAAVGHELRNPLGVVANAHFLLRTTLEGNGDSKALRHLTTAERDTATAALIVSDLLDFARPRDPIPVPFGLSDLVDEVLSASPPPSGVSVHLEVAPDVALVEADRDQLRQVLLNLVSNAYEAMPDGGTVRIAVNRKGETVAIDVSDSGTGMDHVTRERIFEPFFTDKARGVGLGLSVTKRIIDAHGGTIKVDSERGVGSTFSILLPLTNRVEASQA